MKKLNLIDWAFSALLVGNVLQLFIPSSNDLTLAIAPAVAGALISVGGSLLGGMMGRRKGYQDPYAHIYGMAAERAYGQGQRLIDNPYGIGAEGKRAMRNTSRDVFSGGHQMLERQRETNFARSGLDQAGGTKARQDYYAANQFSEGLNTAYNQIEALDSQMKDQQRARGENILMALANKNPMYAQIATQNYWNSINDQNMTNQMIGQSLSGVYENWMAGRQDGNNGPATGVQPGETISDYNIWSMEHTSPPPNPYDQSPTTDAYPTSGG